MPRQNKEGAVKSVNADFDKIATELTVIASKVGPQMPLFSKSVLLSVDILRTYQEAFNAIQQKKTK